MLEQHEGREMASNIVWFADSGMSDVDTIGGKNASLGEMVSSLGSLGVRVPDGFATTAEAYRRFTGQGELRRMIDSRLEGLDTEDVTALAEAGAAIRRAVEDAPLPPELEADIRTAYARLEAENPGASFAVRSSATAEDLPDASFAGQQETFLNVSGVEAVLHSVRLVFASLHNDRAIAYRVHHGFAHDDVAISAGVQRMVRSDLGSAGVAFTLDTETGFADAVFITSSYGLGEAVVQGAVNPDEFYAYKPALRAGRPAVLRRGVGQKALKMVYSDDPAVGHTTRLVPVEEAQRRLLSLTDAQVEELARTALTIEEHYGRPMDVEWALDGTDGLLYILQARPETVETQRRGATVVSRYRVGEHGPVLIEGRAIGQRIGAGRVRVLRSAKEMASLESGDVLVADMTDPDWEPVMKRAGAVVTNRGGRTCHAAIIARELGIPAVVGTGNATEALRDGQDVTVSCAEGDTGRIYEGASQITVEDTDLGDLPDLPVDLMMNVGSPDQSFAFAALPNRGVGLARIEFVVNHQIGIHPRALLEADRLDAPLREEIQQRTAAYADPREFFVSRLAEGVSTIAAAFAPHPVIVRLSDFKSNEYANLLGGQAYEPREENPMLGYRGAARYLSADFQECFAMECEALRRVRDDMGLTNVKVMVPFVRTVAEGSAVVDLLARHGLRRGENGLQIIMMCELPSNAVLAEQFLDHFDGFSIGSNDLTQMTLGLDRDSGLVAESFDERDPAVLALLGQAIEACKRRGKYVGICGQGPSDHPDLAQWLLERGIDTISLNPDTVVDTWLRLSKATGAAN
jgi:pyruvate, water dikinase